METAADEEDPTWAVVGPAWASAWDAFLSMKLLFLSAALASLVLSTFDFYGPLLIGGGQSRLRLALAQFAVTMITLFLRMLILAPVAVAVHRFVLLGERTPGIISLWPAYTRRFALWLCAVSLMFFVVVAVGASLSLQFVLGAFGKLVFFVSMIAAVVCSVFFVLIFPSIAIDEPSSGWRDRLGASWRRMDGHFWLFVGLSIATLLPVVLAVVVFTGGLAAVQIFVLHDSSGKSLAFGMRAGLDLINILTAMLGAAVASRFYARFRDQTLETAP
jgi:hypothetical protein